MPLAVKEALTLFASDAEIPVGGHACRSSMGTAKLVEAVSSSETMEEECIVVADRPRDGLVKRCEGFRELSVAGTYLYHGMALPILLWGSLFATWKFALSLKLAVT